MSGAQGGKMLPCKTWHGSAGMGLSGKGCAMPFKGKGLPEESSNAVTQ